jgi:predicted RNA-binding protein YlxR (DUF448 family)
MAGKKEPVRMCIACRRGRKKEELIRVVKSKDGRIEVDISGKADGRGAYICRNTGCVDAAYKKKGIQRALRSEVGESVYDELRRSVERE